ncbi:MAG TPA: hypothetical protein VEA41_18240 [Salinarimonas sp.]|nr:hypothetical protein [Salinarimonas sp.]
MSHKYKIDQFVRLTRRVFVDQSAGPGDVYAVTRLMPADQTGEASYRIKATGSPERAVRESEIAMLGGDR